MGPRNSIINSNTQEANVDFMNSGTSQQELKGVTLVAGAKPGTNIILTYFRWGSGGNTVLVTGTFTKWIHHVPLHRQRNIWTTTIELERGVYFYKFIVDDEWRFNPEDQTKPDDQGNINNFIDLTKYEGIILNTEEEKLAQEVEMEEEEIDAPTKKPLISVEEFNMEAPRLPPQLQRCKILDLKEQKYQDTENETMNGHQGQKMEVEESSMANMMANLRKRELVQVFDSCHSLEAPTHVALNHVGVKNYQKFNAYAISHRFRSKYTTYKFFTSKTLVE